MRDSETARDETVFGDLEEAVLAVHELHELGEREVVGQQRRITDHEQMLLGTRHGHIQFPVDNAAVEIFKHVIREEFQLIVFLYGKAVDDVLPLRTLVAFDGVDGDVVQDADAVMVDGLTNGSNLIPVRHDDANGCSHIEAMVLLSLIDPCHDGSNHIGLVLVDLVCRGVMGPFGCDEGYSACGQQIVDAILTSPCQRQADFLMRHRNGLQLVAIEGVIGEEGNVGMHTSLLREPADDSLVVVVLLQQALKQGQATIRKMDIVQQRILYF